MADGPKIFAVVEEPETTRRCLMAAAEAAAVRPHGTLVALHVEVDPDRIRAAPEEVALQHLRQPGEGSAHDRAIQIERIFDFWGAAANPSIRPAWQKIVGTVDATLTAAVADADLIVICHPHNLDSADALHAAIFHSHKLVLFVPQAMTGAVRLDHLAIAWKDTPQAFKAVALALPWLRAAKQVSVLIGEDGPAPHSAERLEQSLARNGIAFDLHRVAIGHEGHIGTALIELAATVQADALVMGAYRFGQVVDWIFGGVTSEILQTANLPVFLAH